MRERGCRRLFANRVVPAREADRRERLDLVPVHDGVRRVGMKVDEALPQIDGRQPRDTQGWQEQHHADQNGLNQPLFPGQESIKDTNPPHQRWRPCDQGETDARETAKGSKNRQELQTRGYADVSEQTRRGLEPSRGPVNMACILDGGIADEVSDVLARTVRQRVAEGSISVGFGPRKPVPLLQLDAGGVIDGRGPADIDTHGAVPERQPQNRICRPRQRPTHQPRHHQARGRARTEAFPVHRCRCPVIEHAGLAGSRTKLYEQVRVGARAP